MGAGRRAVSPPAPGRAALLMDLGGVLVEDMLPAAAAKWSARLGITERDFVTAVYAGNDTEVLVGRMSGAAWWSVVRQRLALDEGGLAELRRDLAGDPVWDRVLLEAVAALRGRARIAFVSNAWPDARPNLAPQLSVADEAVLSCEVGFAKPDPRIYRHTLQLLGATAEESLFVDDVPENVEAARALGMAGHLHKDSAGTRAAIEAFAAGLPGPDGD
ncbi:HAD family phosphatase [Streptomyces sp. DW4-2]|uniref:HAD family phosphatase n=1 Tax=Streptomyces spirodelae TaxID=2812904 RepID=A0ABS3WRM1_9ACTN|nr:HAD family phosphatase [Streptomyces spirodelae]